MHLLPRPEQVSAFTVVTLVETSLQALAAQCEVAKKALAPLGQGWFRPCYRPTCIILVKAFKGFPKSSGDQFAGCPAHTTELCRL
ncbi:MAG TPA: hypothetical protein DDW52_26310 [Planctomycetaceae bacterium]|nr:hypothetical protein [Planctomycetaceae bacterium]